MADYTSNTPINKDDYSGVSVGTGYVIVLYKDATCTIQIDMIECILYGDLNGDGSIDGGDIQIVAKVNKSTADIRNSTSLSIPDMEYIDNVYYYAGIVDRSYGVIDGAALQALAKYNKSQEHSDFNESYYVSPSSLVSSE